ncbi:hypothetical protein GCK32_011265, partial [Trichostrongylus colubriformis]
MLITLNRYSAVSLINKYDKIWTRRNVFIMIFAQYIVGFAAFTHVIGTEAIYTRNDDGTFTFVGLEASTNL